MEKTKGEAPTLRWFRAEVARTTRKNWDGDVQWDEKPRSVRYPTGVVGVVGWGTCRTRDGWLQRFSANMDSGSLMVRPMGPAVKA